MKRLAPALNCEPWELLDASGGGLSQDERDLLNSYRSLPDDQRRAIHAYFMAGHKNNIFALYNGLTEADRKIVDWFLFEQHTVSADRSSIAAEISQWDSGEAGNQPFLTTNLTTRQLTAARNLRKLLVRKGGFEPPRSCCRQPLKLVRLRGVKASANA
jgi:hypothetical protein